MLTLLPFVAAAVWDRPTTIDFQPFDRTVIEHLTTQRDIALTVWSSLLNTPYRWAGDDAIAGFDCSGFVIEGLKSAGILPRSGDWTAQTLAEQRFGSKRRLAKHELKPGTLLFWRRGAKIGHVEVVYDIVGEQVLTIGASGGGSRTDSLQDAIDQDAYVKIRPAKDWDVALDPFEA